LRLWNALIVFVAFIAVKNGRFVDLVAEGAAHISQVGLMRVDMADLVPVLKITGLQLDFGSMAASARRCRRSFLRGIGSMAIFAGKM
jgi:hypothetical protein